MPKHDMTGVRFGRWLVLGEAEPVGRNRRLLCRCDCGTERAGYYSTLTQGGSRSCGCYKQDAAAGRKPANTTHGMRNAPEWAAWNQLRVRCRDSENRDYGGRGITACDQWNSFEVFLADMGKRPSLRHSIDRIDNEKGYSPENCRWATRTEQARNRRTNQTITHEGRTLTVAEWAERTGIKAGTIYGRLHRGLAPEQILARDDFRAPIFLTHQGQTLSLREWANRTGISFKTLWNRYRNGWPVSRILSSRP